MKPSENAILIVSCDKYRDLWEPFFWSFFTMWPDCPYRVYLETNEQRYTGSYADRVTTLRAGKTADWSTNVLAILPKIHERYIFMWNEDLFFSSPVSADRFRHYFGIMKSKKANHIHYMCKPAPDAIDGKNKLGVYDRGMPYRSIVMGFWDKEYLTRLVIPGETSWDFEIMASYRTSYSDGFFCATEPIVDFVHMVEKGLWLYRGVGFAKEHGIPISLGARPIGQGIRVQSDMKMWYFNRMLSVPWRTRKAMLDLLRKVFVSY